MKRLSVLILISSLGAAAAQSPRAYYMVPVPPELAAVAAQDMPEGVTLTQENGLAHLVYRLPAELVGPNHPPIDLVQTAATPDWTDLGGHFGTARCNFLTPTAGLCLIDYDNLEIHPEEVTAFLQQKYAGKAELPGRLSVAKIFNNEPAGILRYGDPMAKTEPVPGNP